jgi:threonine dehydratase
MNLPTLAEIETAAQTVYRAMPPTPQYCWPLLREHAGTEVWLKHENHTPVGAFKLRGGLAYFSRLKDVKGVIAATRGNHGQSVAFCARQYAMSATIVVPHGNSAEKNAAMRSLGATLIEHGRDFQAALEHAQALASDRRLHMVPSFHPLLVAGVASAGRYPISRRSTSRSGSAPESVPPWQCATRLARPPRSSAWSRRMLPRISILSIRKNR